MKEAKGGMGITLATFGVAVMSVAMMFEQQVPHTKQMFESRLQENWLQENWLQENWFQKRSESQAVKPGKANPGDYAEGRKS